MPPSLHFALGFILGVLWTFGCFVVQPVAKIKLASLAVFPAIPMSTILHILIFANLAVLNIILIGPRLRSLANKMYLPTFIGSANPVASPPALKTFVRHLSPIPVFNITVALSVHLYRAAVLVIGFITTLIRMLAVFIWNHIPFASILNGIRIVPQLRSIARLVKERKLPFASFKWPAFPTSVVHLTVASLVILYRAAVFVIVFIVGIIRSSALFIWDRIPFLVGLVRSFIPARGKTAFHDDSSVVDYDDETDITLVDESGPQSPSKGSMFITVDKKSIVDVAEVDPAPAPAVSLNPTVPAFVPYVQPQVSSAVARTKQDWQPAKPLSFQWARGGCATRITAPPALAPLDVSAAVFVPAVAAPPIIPVKKALALRTPAPAFWSPGGCAIRIVAPGSTSSSSTV
ncbi:hypothetical protein C8R44DRAFT_983920 [Mycena epipterygia]|nr:hypothetical protein C8R44DRAFT_983920 [Mycena epipterygia]